MMYSDNFWAWVGETWTEEHTSWRDTGLMVESPVEVKVSVWFKMNAKVLYLDNIWEILLRPGSSSRIFFSARLHVH